jgi:hypothetical protein
MESNDQAGIQIAQPKLMVERTRVAERCCAALEISMPLLVDSIENEVGEAYSAFPDRLYIIDRQGRLAFKSGRGPFGFDPREMERALILLLLEGLGSF